MSRRSEPVFYAKIIPAGRNKKGIRIDLSNRVLSWSFEDVESKADKLSLTVDNWDLANFDEPVWRKGNIIEFQFGYIGNMAPSRQCIISSVKGSTELTIEAYSKAYLFDQFSHSRVFEKKTRSQIVKQIAKEHGYGENQQTIDDTVEVFPFITQGAISDARFIRQLTAKQGFEFYIDFDGFHWHKRRLGQKPIKELIWYVDKTGTIVDFTIENDISRQPSFVRVRGRDRIKKKNYTIDVDATKDINPRLGHTEVETVHLPFLGQVGTRKVTIWKNGSDPVLGKIKFKHSSQPEKSLASVKAKGKMVKKRALVVKMSADIVGDPQLIAKSIVRIKGIGKRLSGNYYLKSHKHKGGNGYDGELELVRDGTSENRRSATLFHFVPPTCAGTVSVVRKICKDVSATIDAQRLKPGPTSATIGSLILKSIELEAECDAMTNLSDKALGTRLNAAEKIAYSMDAESGSLTDDLGKPIRLKIKSLLAAIASARRVCKVTAPAAVNAQEFTQENRMEYKNLTTAGGIGAWANLGKYTDSRGRGK